jgi:hypothetical protein
MTRRALGIAVLCTSAFVAAWELRAQQVSATTRFAVVDVYVESSEPLAAWQFELTERGGRMQVVGIEGGESASFGEPPSYDRDAVQQGTADRIIVADFSLNNADELPSGRTRVARVHVRLSGAGQPDYELRLVAAGSTNGRSIDAGVSLDTETGR